jgi:hypothetical protein
MDFNSSHIASNYRLVNKEMEMTKKQSQSNLKSTVMALPGEMKETMQTSHDS